MTTMKHLSKTIALVALLVMPMTAWAGDDDTGLIVGAAAEKKFNKKASIELEAEFRSRNDFRTADRISLGLSGAYKPIKWLKLDAGYQLLIDNNIEKITYNEPTIDDDGLEVINYNNWRPSYWGLRHRVFASVTGSYKIGRVELSIRERWRLTYRPQKTTTRYDFDNQQWEDTQVQSKTQNILRSRFKVDWDIPNCKVDPWASVEVFNNSILDKVRYSLGADYSIQKRHVFSAYYRYQRIYNDDEEGNAHYLGLSYTFKF